MSKDILKQTMQFAEIIIKQNHSIDKKGEEKIYIFAACVKEAVTV